MAFLTRIDPARNINRFYIVDVTPTLFGDWALVREWGRRGSPGTVRLNRGGATRPRRPGGTRSSAGCSTATKRFEPASAISGRSSLTSTRSDQQGER
jgi:predicted DNA-binding WGR domain protein